MREREREREVNDNHDYYMALQFFFGWDLVSHNSKLYMYVKFPFLKW